MSLIVIFSDLARGSCFFKYATIKCLSTMCESVLCHYVFNKIFKLAMLVYPWQLDKYACLILSHKYLAPWTETEHRVEEVYQNDKCHHLSAPAKIYVSKCVTMSRIYTERQVAHWQSIPMNVCCTCWKDKVVSFFFELDWWSHSEPIFRDGQEWHTESIWSHVSSSLIPSGILFKNLCGSHWHLFDCDQHSSPTRKNKPVSGKCQQLVYSNIYIPSVVSSSWI